MQTTTNSTQPSGQDEISVKELIFKFREVYQYLKSRWVIIVSMGVVGAILGFTYAFFKKPLYTAECTFVLEEEGGSGAITQYAGLASMVGIELGGAANGIFQGDNIIELYKSRLMIEKTLLSSADFNGKKDQLINRYIQFNKLRENWRKKSELKSIQFSIPREKFTLQHDSILKAIVKDINKSYLSVEKPDKNLSIIKVEVDSEDELFAKAFNDKLVENVNEFYIQTKTKKSSKNVQLLQRQADSIRQVLNASIGGTAAAIDANPNANPAMQMLRVPSQRRQIDVQASSAIYAEVVKNLEISKISLRKEAPLIQVIDRPLLPLDIKTTSKLKGIVVGGVLGAFLTIAVLILNRIYLGIVSG